MRRFTLALSLSLFVLSSALSSAGVASAQVDDERPPVRPPLTLSASYSLRSEPTLSREPDERVAVAFDVGAAVFYTTSITSFVVSLGSAIAWFGIGASSFTWTVATLGYVEDPYAEERDAAGLLALSTLAVGAATLVGAIVLDVSSDGARAPRLSAGCAPTDGGLTCSLGGAF